ncbi:hypothetical protein [Synechococcus sp. CBW1006]|nr:hypothetical protein [Synechococcus sp. CBW1006]
MTWASSTTVGIEALPLAKRGSRAVRRGSRRMIASGHEARND